MITVYLVRHGDIGLGEGKKYIGIQDHPLSEQGREQALALKEFFRSIPLSKIYCSNLKRSRETAGIIAEVHNIPLIQIPELQEINMGEWEGKPFREIKERYPEEYRLRGEDILNYRPPGGESFRDCAQRVIPVWHKILEAGEGNFLVVGHAGVNRVILCHVLGWPLQELFQLKQSYGCINILRQDANGQWDKDKIIINKVPD